MSRPLLVTNFGSWHLDDRCLETGPLGYPVIRSGNREPAMVGKGGAERSWHGPKLVVTGRPRGLVHMESIALSHHLALDAACHLHLGSRCPLCPWNQSPIMRMLLTSGSYQSSQGPCADESVSAFSKPGPISWQGLSGCLWRN